ncbi:hypothetical protein ACFRNJ_33915 [Streptomyces sp. NPDC056721]|uniref:hypothetical protein n=1 Tax=Streptomyces sp. NPDC056721 TaxID=3345923 RepID=UPI0036BC849A
MSEDSQRQETSRSWWQHLWVWFLGLVAAIVSGIVVAWVTGFFEPDPPSPPRLTDTRYVHPSSSDGELQSPYRKAKTFKAGECPNRSLLSSAPDALRCHVEHTIHDPCWVNAGTAVCLAAPWDHNATVIQQATVTAGPPPTQNLRAAPWALEIRDPSSGSTLQCAGLPGAQDTAAGRRINWDCNDEDDQPAGSGLGSPVRSDEKPWTVLYNPEGSSEVRRADVLTVWY